MCKLISYFEITIIPKQDAVMFSKKKLLDVQVDILFWNNYHPKIGCNVFKKKLLDVQVAILF